MAIRLKRGYEFRLSFIKNICTVTAVRKGVLYFRSEDGRYQMPLDVFIRKTPAKEGQL